MRFEFEILNYQCLKNGGIMEEPKIEAIEPCSFLIGYVIVYITLYIQSTSKF